MVAHIPQKDWEESYVGPSKCDERRLHREKEVDDAWNNLGLQKFNPENIVKLNPALDLFREACSCYQNGAFLASAIMCGVSVESALYLLVSRAKKNPATMAEEIDFS